MDGYAEPRPEEILEEILFAAAPDAFYLPDGDVGGISSPSG